MVARSISKTLLVCVYSSSSNIIKFGRVGNEPRCFSVLENGKHVFLFRVSIVSLLTFNLW